MKRKNILLLGFLLMISLMPAGAQAMKRANEDPEGGPPEKRRKIVAAKFTDQKFHFCSQCGEVRSAEDYWLCRTCTSDIVDGEAKQCFMCGSTDVIFTKFCKPIAVGESQKAKHQIKEGDLLDCNIFKRFNSDKKENCCTCLDPGDIVVPCLSNDQVIMCKTCFHEQIAFFANQNQIILEDDKASFPCFCGDNKCRFTGIEKVKGALLSNDGGHQLYEMVKKRLLTQVPGTKPCPQAGCEGLFFLEDLEGLSFVSCPYKQPAHKICTSCFKLYEKNHECGKEDSAALLPFGDNLKPCPNPDCNKIINKDGGCDMMVCGRGFDNIHDPLSGCGVIFCWSCGKYKRPRTSQWLQAKSNTPTEHGSGYFFGQQEGHNHKWYE